MKHAKFALAAAAAAVAALQISAADLAPVTDNAKAEAKTEAKADAKAVPQPKANDPTTVQMDGEIAAQEAKEAEQKKPDAAPVYKKSKLIKSVIITANYELPRLFAEVACRNNKVPFIMIIDSSNQPKADAQLAFFTPASEEPVLLTAKDLSKLLAYLRARDVIILGNTDYVPAFYAKAVPPSSRTVLINDADWYVNAVKLSSMLNSNVITDTYKQHRADRKADLEKKREAYQNAEKEKAKAIENASQKQKELIEAESL